MHTHKNNCSFTHLEIANSCLTDVLIEEFSGKTKTKASKNTVIVTPKSMRSKVISNTYGDVML
jgi:hypothetical protein